MPKILSGSWLKVIALAAMIIDHVASALLRSCPVVLFGSLPLYTFMRYIGRIAFPIYCFLLVEGFQHTKNRKKYALNLLAFALITELPWNLLHSGSLFYSSQNVFFTLFLSFIGLCLLEMYEGGNKKAILGLFAILVVSLVDNADYSTSGLAFILIMYMLRERMLVMTVVGCCYFPQKWIAGLAFIPINLYNGKRGFIRGGWKYVFYAAYPVHMMVLWYIKLKTIGF